MDGAGPYTRGVQAARGSEEFAVPGRVAVYNFNVTNTGEATDLFRLNATTEAGWELQLENNVIEVESGETVQVPVYVKIPDAKNGPKPTELTFTTTSETDNSKTSTVVHKVGPGKGK